MCRLAAILCACVAAGSAGCGRGGSGGTAAEKVVAQVGHRPITAAMLGHWMQIFAPGHLVPDPPRYAACVARLLKVAPHSETAELERECRRRRQALQQQALDLLISTRWLVGEAADLGVPVSRGDVERRVEERKRSFPNGVAEYGESLRAIGYTPSDAKLEIEAELAAQKIRQSLRRSEPQISEAEISAYYRRNIRRYRISERRRIYIAENLKSKAAADRLTAEVAHGRSLAGTSLDESFQRREIAQFQGEKRVILEAIFAAKPHVVATPVELNHLYFVFEVTEAIPAHLQPLSTVHGSIARRLAGEQSNRTLARFVGAWRRRWLSRTDCSAGFVVQKCRQYAGARTPEDPLKLD